MVGDLNVWHKKWLKHSPSNTAEGEQLQQVCHTYSLVETVRKPTREGNLLDLVLTNFASNTTTTLLPKLADHCGVLARVEVPTPQETVVTREVWCYKRAKWNLLKEKLQKTDWAEVLQGDGHAAAQNLTDYLLEAAKECIPKRRLNQTKSSHPWLNERCKEALRAKQVAEGTEVYTEAARACREIFQEEYLKHTEALKERLRTLPRGSKLWWRLNRELLHNTPCRQAVPSLKDEKGDWVHNAKGKAELFRKTFQEKSQLPTEPEEEFYTPTPSGNQMPRFTAVRVRWAKKALKELEVDTATGPDKLPARILRECAEELALPVTLLIRKLLSEGCWPNC